MTGNVIKFSFGMKEKSWVTFKTFFIGSKTIHN